MKKSSLLLAVMLLLSVCVWADEPTKYTVSHSPSNPLVNGDIHIPDKLVAPGTVVTVTCKPSDGYGLSRGVYYATRTASGGLSVSQLAENTSHDPDDRANDSQTFSFTMPAADVEVWAYFTPLRELRIHQPKNSPSKLVPTYGLKAETNDYAVVKNIPKKPIYLKIKPQAGYELVDVEKTNIAPGYYERLNDSIIKIFMPTDDIIMHVTPIFGQDHYNVTMPNTMDHIEATITTKTPKARQEIDLTLVTDNGYIPANVTITGCKSSWLLGKPERLENGKWKTVYRIKVDLQDVTITYGVERVYNIKVSDTKNSKRVKTYIPEMIPGYADVARSGQQIPLVFLMPDSFFVQCQTKGAAETPLVYHNALKNSFADQDMDYWDDSTDATRLPVMVFADSSGNKYWRTSGVNSMSQTVDLSKLSIPASAKQGGKLKVAAIASVNPCNARSAKVSIVAEGNGNTETLVVADPSGTEKDWITEFIVGKVSATATKLQLQVEAKADDENKRSYEGPMFDDLCLLVPTKGDSIRNEDVLIFKMGNSDITINYTSSGNECSVSVVKKEHATLTLHNTATDEKGETVKAMTGDVILITGKADDGYAVYDVLCDVPADEESNARGFRRSEEWADDWDDVEPLEPDSVNTVTNETFFRYVKADDSDIAVTPTVDKQKVMFSSYYGGKITVDNESAKKGETVVVTVIPKAGCQLKQIRTIPANAAQFTEVQVDKNTGAGTYSFVMPGAYITLKGEFIVPITTAQQIDSISNQCGTFRLDNDLDLGNQWNNKKITLIGDFDGNGHRITYGGNTSLFQTISPKGSVRHLYVNANVKGIVIGEASDDYMGGICMKNNGVIEDCEVSGSVKNERPGSFAGGIAGLNGFNKEGGTIAYCHVLCDGLEATGISYGIARQEKHAVIKDNVFSGMFGNGDTRTYMICNGQDSVTIERNYYVPNAGNSRAVLCKGVSAATSAILTAMLKNVPESNYVFTASIKSKYVGGYDIKLAETTDVSLVNLSTDMANAGTVVTASVSVSGNNHLEGITISAPDGSDAFQCPFTDNMENVYTFTFTMPDHEVKITPQTKEGRFIYTASQFADINDQPGIYYLARDIDLNNWGKDRAISLKGTFYGGGHTIRYHEEGAAAGLFSIIKESALLEGLRVAGIVTSTENCAGIAYENYGTIRNCHFCGEITRIAEKKSKKNRIAALVFKNAGDVSQVDHCSATGVLTIINKSNQQSQVVDKNTLYVISDASRIKDCVWIGEQNTTDQERQKAQALLNDYPVYAQGILDRIDTRITTGSQSQTVTNGQTLAELTITDGEPFVCTSDVQVNRVIYKRKATKSLEEWVLPFAFTQIAGDGQFTYHEAVENNNMPDLGPAHTLTLSNAPQSVAYAFNQPWLVSNGEDGEEKTYVLSNRDGSPITIKATNDHRVARYKSIMDIGNFFAAYDTIPAKTVNDELIYVWDSQLPGFVLPDGSTSIQPNRFYLQFYNVTSKKNVKYSQTQWAKMENATPSTQAKAPRRLAAAVADGWQPIFLDPRQPQSITARMLDYYDVAYLADIRGEVLDEEDETPLSVVSLVYMMADDRMDLPAALPLLVRAKRSDAEPLVDAKTGAELEELLMQMMEEDDDEDYDDEDYDFDDDDSLDFDIPHYWCASFDNRLDIWQLPAPERYADLYEYGCMMFNDNSYDQSFTYATADDTRTTTPMSYCITLLNSKTYELLPLLGDRVCVEFLVPAGETTGVRPTPVPSLNGGEWYDLQGRKLQGKPSTKGLYIVNGRKMIKK